MCNIALALSFEPDISVCRRINLKLSDYALEPYHSLSGCSRGSCQKGVNFVNLIDAGDPVEQAKAYEQQGADELVFLDITASSDERAIMHDVVERTASECFMPLTVGGGIRNLEDIRKMLNAGADKVSLNTAALIRIQTL